MSLHGTDNAAMRWTLGPIGVVGALVLLGVSCTMNYRFGQSLGKTPFDGYVYGLASIAADVFKAIAPFFFFAAWRSRAWAVMTAAFVVWLVTTVYALTGALGHSLLNRTETAGQRTLAAETHKDLRADLKRNQDQLSWLPPHRAAAAVKSELEALKAQRLWLTTAECQEATGKTSREFCSSYHKVDAELGNALQADKLNAKIEEINKKLSGTKSDAMSDSDPQADTISKALDVGLSKVQLGLALLVVALIEFGSGFGPYVSLAYMFAFGQSRSKIIDADYTNVASIPLKSDPALLAERGLPPPSQPVPGQQITGDGSQRDNHAPRHPAPNATRVPLPGSEPSLIEIGFPLIEKPARKRDKSPPREAAERFAVWLRAMGLVAEPLSDDDITRFYQEFCDADHRAPTADNLMRGELKTLRIVEWSKPRLLEDGKVKRQSRWVIRPGKYPKPAPPPEPAPEPVQPRPTPKQEGGRLLAFARRPLAVAPERAHMGSRRTYAGNVYRNRQLLLTSRRAA